MIRRVRRRPHELCQVTSTSLYRRISTRWNELSQASGEWVARFTLTENEGDKKWHMRSTIQHPGPLVKVIWSRFCTTKHNVIAATEELNSSAFSSCHTSLSIFTWQQRCIQRRTSSSITSLRWFIRTCIGGLIICCFTCCVIFIRKYNTCWLACLAYCVDWKYGEIIWWENIITSLVFGLKFGSASGRYRQVAKTWRVGAGRSLPTLINMYNYSCDWYLNSKTQHVKGKIPLSPLLLSLYDPPWESGETDVVWFVVCWSDVEAVVEEMRLDAVSRRCHVNSKDVESLALVLSQLSRSMATLKSTLSFYHDSVLRRHIGVV